MVRNLPANAGAAKDTGLPSQGREGRLEKGMATHSSILAWRIPWTEEPGRLCGVAKNVPAMQETQVPSLDWKDRREKGMATHSSVLAWRIP